MGQMTLISTRWLIALLGLTAVAVLPLCGVLLAGHSVGPYLEFPPRPRSVTHEPFSWPVFIGLATCILVAVAPFVSRVIRSQAATGGSATASRERALSDFTHPPRASFHTRPSPGCRATDDPGRRLSQVHPPAPRIIHTHPASGCSATASRERALSDFTHPPWRAETRLSQVHPPAPRTSESALSQAHSFPWWGWAGLVWTGLAWILAWNRWEWVGEWQLHTFTPLWLGYIVVINALTVSRVGSCLMQRDTGRFLSLFPISAVFWWSFEYLNRFVENWYYVGVRESTAGEYIVLATVPFSTVLPAVLSTAEWVRTYPRLSLGLARAWRMPLVQGRRAGWILLAGAGSGLIGISLWPEVLFPLVWVAPLLLVTGLQLLMKQETIFAATARGDWKLLWISALASLMCGVFWEMWNSGSLAHWEYGIPFTHRFQLFEMPLLGYAGYLPFGLECVAIVQLFFPTVFTSLQESPVAEVAARPLYPDEGQVNLSSASSSFSARNTMS